MSKSNLSLGTKGWADRINAAWRKSAASFIEAGRLLIECKKTVPHGAFKTMLSSGELDFEERTAQRLMVIGADTRFDNPSILSLLPPSYTTLYDLTKLQDDEFERALSSGTINPKMHGSDVPKKRKESPVGDAVSDQGSSESATRLAAAEDPTPLDDREGGDSVVTEHDPERAAVADLERKSPEEALNLNTGSSGVPSVNGAGGSSETNARHSAPVRMGGAHRPEAHPSGIPGSLHGEAGGSPATHPDGSVTLHVKPSPISRLSCGLALVLRASKELSPEDAVEEYPEDMRLSTDDIAYVTSWLLAFEDADKARIGAVEAAQ